jgi:hypothetical protein
MSIFSKPLSQLEPADLQELLQNRAVENVRLEFKSQVPDKDETLKKLSSFGNSFGGFVIIGAKAASSDARIEGLPGVPEQAGYKQKVVQWCFDAVSPPLVVEVSDPIPAANVGTFLYVIYTAESDVAPHFLNGRKGVWVRTDEFSQRYEPRLATENEIRHLLDRRRLIQERRTDIIKRSQRRFELFRSRQKPALVGAARLECSVGPRFPARPVCEQAKLALDLQDVRIQWRGTTFPRRNSLFVSQHESVLLLTPADVTNRVGLVETSIWGMLFYVTELAIEIGPLQTLRPDPTILDPTIKGIHLYRLVGYLLVFCEHAKQTLSRVGYLGPLSIDLTLGGILGVPWLYSEGGVGIYTGPVSELDDEFSFSLSTTTEELRERRDAIVMRMLEYILFGMNWADYASNPSVIEKLVRSGYEYNFWGKPTALQV